MDSNTDPNMDPMAQFAQIRPPETPQSHESQGPGEDGSVSKPLFPSSKVNAGTQVKKAKRAASSTPSMYDNDLPTDVYYPDPEQCESNPSTPLKSRVSVTPKTPSRSGKKSSRVRFDLRERVLLDTALGKSCSVFEDAQRCHWESGPLTGGRKDCRDTDV